ncbi:MAG TPA: M20/M25/M40 family metallo-hydrolase [Terriglobales bacterium]|nr:M20/M25/M40 family metallo-hydrolase [Terriglobales bacterium]
MTFAPSVFSARKIFASLLVLSLSAFPLFAQTSAKPDSKKAAASSKNKTATAVPLAPKLDPNAVDWATIGRIRYEAFRNSKVMVILSDLTDRIGPRLTNSPNMRKASAWTRDELTKYGLENSHLEAWGPFGRGWSYEVSNVRLISPDKAELLALPKAWTPGTNGPVRGKVMRFKAANKEELEKYRGKIAGAILLGGDMREIKASVEPKSERYDEKSLAALSEYTIPAASAAPANAPGERQRRAAFQRELLKFLEEEKALALLEPSRAPGDGGTVFVQGGGSYKKGESVGIPNLVMAIEHYGRISRLLDKKVDVEVEVNVKTSFHDDDEFAYNTIAEIPGTDLKDQVVMLGAHLDSWHGGTGATDNAAGSAVAMEVVRILKSIGVKPRRTIRIALWSGEEQGLMGSRAYVSEHLASRPENTDPQYKDTLPFLRPPAGPLQFKPEWDKVSVYFNIDNGTGKLRGLWLQENAMVIPIFKQWMEPFADLGMNTLTMRNTGGSDFLSFDGVGVPGFGFLQDEIEYDTRTHHSNMDTYERIQREDMMQAAAIEAAFVYQAAMRDEMMPRKPIPPDPPRRADAPASTTPPAATTPPAR